MYILISPTERKEFVSESKDELTNSREGNSQLIKVNKYVLL